MKVLYYVVYVEDMPYYFSPDELAKVIELSEDYWLIQMAYIDTDRNLWYRDYDRQRGEFAD